MIMYTLVNVEKGSPSVAMGIYMSVLNSLSLENDMLLVAKDDELGRKLQDLKLVTRKRAPKSPKENQSNCKDYVTKTIQFW